MVLENINKKSHSYLKNNQEFEEEYLKMFEDLTDPLNFNEPGENSNGNENQKHDFDPIPPPDRSSEENSGYSVEEHHFDKIYDTISEQLLEEIDSESNENSDENDSIEDETQTQFSQRIQNLDDLEILLENSTKYQDAKRSLDEDHSLFTDFDFLPKEKSLIGYSKNRSDSRIYDLEWYRSNEYFSGNIHVYENISPGDIQQGRLGDCYFLAAISALAEHPSRIERLFLTKTNNNNGLFAVALCINGVWQEVILDDYAPCTSSKKLAFNSSKENELWVVLLEKAWAKVHKGYFNIEAGLTREALRDLTGASVTTYFTKKNPDSLWKKLKNAEQSNFVMTAGSKNLSGGSDEYLVDIGLSGSHAYSLLAVYTINKKTGSQTDISDDNTQHRLVKLRNPWGKGEWKGKWSDEDPRWTNKLKKKLGFSENPNDGIFFMEWEDFLENFSDVQICYYHDDFKYNAEEFITKKNETIFLKFELKSKGQYYISVNQRNKRFYSKEEKYKYSDLSWTLGRKTSEGFEFVENGRRIDKENWQGIDAQAGEYVVMIHTPWRSKTRKFSFSIYGPDFVKFELIKDEMESRNFIKEVYKSRAINELVTKGTLFDFENIREITYVRSNHNGWSYVYLQNHDHYNHAHLELISNEKHSIPRLDRNSKQFNLSVAPGESDIIVYQIPHKKKGFTNIDTSISNEYPTVNANKIKSLNNRFQKKINGEFINVFAYFYPHKNGLSILYENECDYDNFNEKVELNLENAIIVDGYDDYNESSYSVDLNPGEQKVVMIKREDLSKDFKITIDNLESLMGKSN
jgi:calpain-15